MIVTLALGIGGTAAMVDLVDRLMFRPLQYLDRPDEVHRLYWPWDERERTTPSPG